LLFGFEIAKIRKMSDKLIFFSVEIFFKISDIYALLVNKNQFK
tara:strand:+ start:1436 stop:1564 length:129 start_codon:yes stop_codon:yes gene_type:complete